MAWAWRLAAALDPGKFVIGGGLCDAGELLVGPARKSFLRNLTGRGFRPAAEFELAALGPNAGLIGAADLWGQQPHAHVAQPKKTVEERSGRRQWKKAVEESSGWSKGLTR